MDITSTTVMSKPEYIDELLRECKLAVGLRRLKGKKIDWEFLGNDEPYQGQYYAEVSIDETDENHFTIRVSPVFDTIDWTIYDEDEDGIPVPIDEITFDNYGKYIDECNRRLDEHFFEQTKTLLHGLNHAINWSCSEQEVAKKAKRIAKKMLREMEHELSNML